MTVATPAPEYRYRGYTITRWLKPGPTRAYDWDFQHEGYDGPGDERCGSAASPEAARQLIDEIEGPRRRPRVGPSEVTYYRGEAPPEADKRCAGCGEPLYEATAAAWLPDGRGYCDHCVPPCAGCGHMVADGGRCPCPDCELTDAPWVFFVLVAQMVWHTQACPAGHRTPAALEGCAACEGGRAGMLGGRVSELRQVMIEAGLR